MYEQEFWSAKKAVLTIAAMTFMLVSGAWAATEQVLYSFNGTTGREPSGGLIFDKAGNLYGTTIAGGNGCSCGVVFELTPASGGGWTETVIHRFNYSDGASPTAPLVFDQEGNLYGTAETGGENNGGVVFELSPSKSGGWSEKVLHTFTGGDDGEFPLPGLAIDPAGNLYGTTYRGGRNMVGVAFELLPTSSGWKHKVLWTFGRKGGKWPEGGLIFDQAGNLYGTTAGGGVKGLGVVFELTPNVSGVWKETVLYVFKKDGEPVGQLTFDGQGNLYGTTNYLYGAIFELSPSSGGAWKQTILHYGGHKGGYGVSGLIFDGAGNLYGAAGYGGGLGLSGGDVFRLTPTSKGLWKEKVLHSFGSANDGSNPAPGGLVFDSAGNLYGATYHGPTNPNDGTVFEVTP
jgi:uncharacterized repeat protein (TIGR03803 family)